MIKENLFFEWVDKNNKKLKLKWKILILLLSLLLFIFFIMWKYFILKAKKMISKVFNIVWIQCKGRNFYNWIYVQSNKK